MGKEGRRQEKRKGDRQEEGKKTEHDVRVG